MASDFNKPLVGDPYATSYANIVGNLQDLAKGLDPATCTVSNPPTNAIRWNSASNLWQKWTGSSWVGLSNLYAINISGNAASATLASGVAWVNVSGKPTTFTGYGISDTLDIARGGTGAATAAAARTSLGLGSAATLTAGVAANNAVQLDGSARLPAVDGSQLTGISSYTNANALSLFNASGAAPVYAPRAWVNFNGTGTVANLASGNVSSITDNGAGDYTINFTTAMPDANYSIFGTTTTESSYAQPGGVAIYTLDRAAGSPALMTASAIRIRTGFGSVAAGYDFNRVCFGVIR